MLALCCGAHRSTPHEDRTCAASSASSTLGAADHRARAAAAHERVAAPSRPRRRRPASRARRRRSATGACRSSTSRPASSRCTTRTASVVVVFNGEIYNYQELIPELQALGHVFRTQSDTEVIVHAWEAWGEACVERFRGMFAFALWDRNRETLFLARDRLGVKPLYYALLPDGTLRLRLRAEVAARARRTARARSIRCAVEEYFALGYVPEPRTIFTAARKLPPAHTLTLRRGAAAAASRAILGRALHARQPDQRATTRRPSWSSALRESVRLRMISEVPLGAFLSGGVDSSAVVAMMAGLSRRAGQHLLDRLRRSGVRRIARSRSRSPSATARGTSSTASRATTSTSSTRSPRSTTSPTPTARRSRPTASASWRAST